ncbi:MAG: acyl-CoA thioesterase [Ignavibacteriales bacterium]|nr:acyl-CoA thioesterase [Ignavibacteriales bacterium]
MKNNLFKHFVKLRVRNFEVDWQNIVHNSIYLQYFEIGRVEYLKNIGIDVSAKEINNNSRVVVVRNEINYISPARFDESLIVQTRIKFIKNSSFGFEGIITEEKTKRLISDNISIHAWLHQKKDISKRIDDAFRRKVKLFEGKNVDFIS